MLSDDIDVRLATLEEKFRGAREALGLQADEYSRRLDDLNNAHREAVGIQKHQLPREVYDRSEARLSEWRGSVESRLNIQQGKDSGKAAILAAIASVIALLISVAGLVVRMIH